MGLITSQITSLRLFTQRFIRAQIKENIKAPRHWPLYGEFTSDRWIPRTKGQERGIFRMITASTIYVQFKISIMTILYEYNRY